MRTAVSLDRAGTVIASATQDVEPILERNRRLRAEPQASDWGRHVATIPNVILLKWLNEAHAGGNTGLRMFTRNSTRSSRASSKIRTGNTCAPTNERAVCALAPRGAPRYGGERKRTERVVDLRAARPEGTP